MHFPFRPLLKCSVTCAKRFSRSQYTRKKHQTTYFSIPYYHLPHQSESLGTDGHAVIYCDWRRPWPLILPSDRTLDRPLTGKQTNNVEQEPGGDCLSASVLLTYRHWYNINRSGTWQKSTNLCILDVCRVRLQRWISRFGTSNDLYKPANNISNVEQTILLFIPSYQTRYFSVAAKKQKKMLTYLELHSAIR